MVEQQGYNVILPTWINSWLWPFNWIGLVIYFGTYVVRWGWSAVYLWHNLYWVLVIYLFHQFFFLFILDGWGWFEMDPFYEIIAPRDKVGNYEIVDKWVEENTWTLAMTIQVVENELGVRFDPSNTNHIAKLRDYTWPYIYEQMNIHNALTLNPGIMFTNTFWIILCPSMYVDEEGYALDGYPQMLAQSNELSKMYWGDYSWLEKPKRRDLKLDAFTFFGTWINNLWGACVYYF